MPKVSKLFGPKEVYLYKDVAPIEQRSCAAWRVTFSHKVLLVLTDSKMTIEEVIQYMKTHNEEGFSVRQIGVGEYLIDETLNEYSPDGRSVTDQMQIKIGD